MRKTIVAALILLMGTLACNAGLASGTCYPKSACKAECEKTRREILKIQAKMRQGYGASAGARMEARLRELRKLRSKYCR